MKNSISILLFILISIQFSFSQIYIFSSDATRIISGPDNLNLINESVTNQYLEKIDNSLSELNNEFEKNTILIEQFSKKKKKANKLKEKNNNIALDIENLNSFKNLWNESKNEQIILQTFFNDLKKEYCQVIETGKGKFLPGEYILNVKKTNKFTAYKEIIPVEYKTMKGIWVKKKNPNCIETDSNDCSVLCWEEVPDILKYKDYQGNLQESETCPIGFKFSKKDKACINNIQAKKHTKALTLLRVSDGKELKLISWEKSECEES